MLGSVAIAVVVGYLLGAIPVGYLYARAHGVNIFEVGSKNPGATNVGRVLGPKAGKTVFAIDALKGAIATGWPWLALLFLPNRVANWNDAAAGHSSVREFLELAGLASALLGHSFSCFTHFRGGKGVATASGGMLVLMPLGAIAAVIVWTVTYFSSRYVSLASIFAALTLPIAALGLHGSVPLVVLASLVAFFVIIRHRANIERLLSGTESRFSRSK